MAYFYGAEDVAWIITAIDTLGAATPLHPDAGRFRWPRASPDGRTLLIADTNDERLWTLDLVTRAFRPFPVEERWPGEPTWSADGRRIAYTIEVGGDRPFATIYGRNADGTGSAQVLAAPPFDAWTSSWSPDGRYLAFYGGLEQLDIWVQDLERDTLHQVTSARSAERHPDFSPDGRWIAYQSDESGRNEIWVRGFPDFERRHPISIDGGTEPIWATNGRELFFRNGSQIMVVEYSTGPTFSSGPPRELLRTFLEDDVNGDVSYSVMPDDRTFVIVRSDPRSSPELRVIKDWVSDLKRRTRR